MALLDPFVPVSLSLLTLLPLWPVKLADFPIIGAMSARADAMPQYASGAP
ncbi:hypothetical protein PO883_22060 [Massilia sp. DJPM01]|nr:hypothetical protein [Massilia sp. DJPM01]MDM5179880.1 hypothetical protein [Massilia sp. DJPM01]